MSAKSYIIRMARPEERSTLVKFLLQHYTPRLELLARYFRKNAHRIDETEKRLIEEDMKNRYKAVVSKGIGHVAIDGQSKDIVGVSLMSLKENPKFPKATRDREDPIYSVNSVVLRSKVYADFVNYVLNPLEDINDIFDAFPTIKTIAEHDLLSVNLNYSSRGLATSLTQEVLSHAVHKGAGLIYGICMSPYTRKTTMNSGFALFSEMDIMSLRDSDGSVIYEGTEPFVVAKTVKHLPSSSAANEKASSGRMVN